jgi:hypothetical protein
VQEVSRFGSASKAGVLFLLVLFAGGAEAQAATTLTYAHVWASAAPEPFASEGARMLADGRAIVVMVPREQLEASIGRHLASNGWITSAFSRPDQSPCIIVIANDVPAAAIPGLRAHEAAHCARHGEWDNHHEGALKPLGHLERCLATGLPLRQIASLCRLNEGAPLRGGEAEQWARLQAQSTGR